MINVTNSWPQGTIVLININKNLINAFVIVNGNITRRGCDVKPKNSVITYNNCVLQQEKNSLV